MLSAEQLLQRQAGIGASDVPAILGLDRFRTELDVWSSKRRGPDLSIPPIAAAEPAPDKPGSLRPIVRVEPMVAGSILEDGIVQLFEHATGAETKRCKTLQHRRHPWALATPDRRVRYPGDTSGGKYRRGLETKLVGHWMTDDWAGEALPERVWVQCQWGMAVSGFKLWDACALLDGSRLRIHRIRRDNDWIAEALEVVGDWWEFHILGDEPPEPRDASDLARMTRRRHPTDNGQTLDAHSNPVLRPIVEPLMVQLAKLTKARKRLEEHERECKAKLESLCGPHRKMTTRVGSFTSPFIQGRIDYKALAQHLNGGEPVEVELADAFRGDGHRRPALHTYKDRR